MRGSVMNRMKVIECGPGVTVQDLGRRGASRFGLAPSGALDQFALRAANVLTGNPLGTAALEFALTAGRFEFSAPVVVTVTGGECRISVGDRILPPWSSFNVRAGDVLTVGPVTDGVYGYLAVAGGIDVPEMLGARATHSRFGLGGLEGRMLKSGDVLDIGADAQGRAGLGMPRIESDVKAPFGVVAGPQADFFSDSAWVALMSAEFIVTAKRDRMAMLLDGPALDHKKGFDIVSDGTVFGSIQVPGNGKPLVLLADRGTTGGYPKIATVISADLARLVQIPAGRKIRFRQLSVAEAEDAALAARERELTHLRSIGPKNLAADLSSKRLLSLNLVDGVRDALEEV